MVKKILGNKEQPYFGLKGKWLTFWITVACATDMSLFGYDQGVFSGVVISKDYLDVHDLVGPSKINTLSIITSIYTIGCFLGALGAFSIGERLGRKKTIVLGTAVMTVGAILQTSSFSVPHMIVARIVTGIGNGINTATAPVWQTETSKVSNRGKLVVFEMSMNIFGFMLSNWVNYGLSYVGGSIAWRLPLAIQLVFCAILFSTVPWLPESPRWLIAHGRHEEASVILADLQDKPVGDAIIIAERQEIIFSVEYERKHAVRWRDLVRGRATAGTNTVRRLLLGVGSQAFQQLGGINVMSYYLPTLLKQSVHLEDKMARLIAALASVSYLFASLIAAPFVERFGRRKMMLISTLIQLICFILLTVLLYYTEKPGYPFQTEVAKASVVWFFLYYMGFGLGMLGIPWLYPTEINSLPMRTKGAAVATMTDWITNFLVVEITPIGITNLGWRFYIIWAVVNAVALPVIWAFFPETANRTLEDLDAYYRDNPPLLVIKDKDATCVRRPQKFVLAHDRDVEQAAAAAAGGTLSRRSVHENATNEKSSSDEKVM
ncbi:hexose carrier protein [Poronia punctata]|nr:hexose carrier protein [Poronia punctata]